ncbi:MAG: HD domain-containing protein [Bacteroides cellulosilyticus]|nr:HD domain-containing protein [Bacteroides cellulosilyticus]
MEEKKYRKFVDAVYGHICLPKEYCQKIVDSLLYQRLKRIEQTSMRPIFPSAHHDRFSHSLGTYHIGEIIFRYLESNTRYNPTLYERINQCIPGLYKQYRENKEKQFWDLIRCTYELACLLHDCGHAPFSHTFEDYYLSPTQDGESITLKQDILKAYEETINYINAVNRSALGKKEIKRLVDEFKNDFLNCEAKPHEMVSAWLCLQEKGFRNQVHELNGDPLLVARMIMGCKYLNTSENFDNQIYNCFIGLLNGDEIDADRTDYAMRDQWATGLNTIVINLERLFSSIHIVCNEADHQKLPRVCFSKNALPELEKILEIKNYNSFWIFNHHKVLYHERVLRKAVGKLALLFEGSDAIKEYLDEKKQTEENCELKADGIENKALYHFFDYHNLIESKPYILDLGKEQYHEELYLISDDDIVHLLKKFFCVNAICHKNGILKDFYNRTNYAQEWLSRNHLLIPLWKSYVEFLHGFLSHHYELISLEQIINLIERGRIPEKKTLADVQSLLDNAQLSKSLTRLKEIYGKDEYTIVKLLTSCTDKNKKDVFFAKWYTQLKSQLAVYQNQSKADIQDAINTAVSNLRHDGFKLDSETYKLISIDSIKLRPIEENCIFVDMKDGNIVEYTQLGIPSKNQKKEYNFFYVYLPYLSENDSRLEKKKCRDKYTEAIQKCIEQIIHPVNL